MRGLFSEPASHEDALTPAVLLWAGLGILLHVGLVVVGHYSDAICSAWPVPSMLTAALSGTAYVIHKRRSFGDSAWHGGMVDGICAFLGTALAAVLADVPAVQLATVTLGGIAVGGGGGLLIFAVIRPRQPRTSRVAT